MIRFFEWFFELPWYAIVGTWAGVGAVVGVFARLLFARHLWIRHQHDHPASVSGYNCWCEPDFGDFINGCIYIAPVIWPVITAVLVLVMPSRIYFGVQRLVQRWVIRGLKGMRADIDTLEKAKEKITSLEWNLKDSQDTVTQLRNLVHARDVEIGDISRKTLALEAKLKEYERVKPADERVDRVLDRSAKLLDEINSRPIDDPDPKP